MIFIVDDDPAVREAVALLVRSFGWNPRTFASAEEFLGTYERTQRGCLVLDLHMPGMSGPELQDALLALGIHLPVIVVTAYRDDPLARRATRAGALAVIAKPFRHAELSTWIEKALDARPAG